MARQGGFAVWESAITERLTGRYRSVYPPFQMGSLSFARLQHFAVGLLWVKRELEQQNVTHTNRGCWLCDARSMEMTYFLSAAPWTATAAHVNSPTGTRPLHPNVLFFRWGVDSSWLLTLITFWVFFLSFTGDDLVIPLSQVNLSSNSAELLKS